MKSFKKTFIHFVAAIEWLSKNENIYSMYESEEQNDAYCIATAVIVPTGLQPNGYIEVELTVTFKLIIQS